MRWRIVKLLVPFWLIVVGSKYLPAQTGTIDHVVDEINEKRGDVNCVYYEAKGTVTFPKQSIRTPDGQLKTRESETVKPCLLTVLIDLETPRLQIHDVCHLPIFRSSKLVGYKEYGRFINFNKELAMQNLSSDWVRELPISYGLFTICYRPFFLAHGIVPLHGIDHPRPFDRPLSSDDFVARRDAQLQGRKIVVLRTRGLASPGQDPHYYFEYWFEREYWNIVRIDQFSSFTDHDQYSIEIQYDRRDTIWVPKKCRMSQHYYWKGAPIDRIYDYEITDFQLNPDYDSLSHEFDLTNGVQFRGK